VRALSGTQVKKTHLTKNDAASNLPEVGKPREARTVTAKVDGELLDALDAFRAEKAREGLTIAESQALVAMARRGAGLTDEKPLARRKAG